MHQDIVRFTENGRIKDDSHFESIKRQMEKVLIDQMYLSGYLPVIDIGLQWTTHRNEEEDYYDFVISLYGVRVESDKMSRDKAWSSGVLLKVR